MFRYSLECYLPKSSTSYQSCLSHLLNLSSDNLDFISCTWGTGDHSVQDQLSFLNFLKTNQPKPIISHIISNRYEPSEYNSILESLNNLCIMGLLPLKGNGSVERNDEHLWTLARIHLDYPRFTILTTAYPDKFYDDTTLEQELDYVRGKCRVSCTTKVVGQFSYSVENLVKTRDYLAQFGYEFIPGIFPVYDQKTLANILPTCKSFNDYDMFSECTDEEFFSISLGHLDSFISALESEGFSKFHFYMMNRSKLLTQFFKSRGVYG